MIKKIVSAKEFEKAFLDLETLFREENKKYGHSFLKINHQSVIDSIAHASVLNNIYHCWVNFEENLADGMIIFLDCVQPFLAERMFMETFWISKNAKTSFALYNKAVKFAKEKGIKYINMNCVENHPKSNRLKKIYLKMGFKKDTESYIKKL